MEFEAFFFFDSTTRVFISFGKKFNAITFLSNASHSIACRAYFVRKINQYNEFIIVMT